MIMVFFLCHCCYCQKYAYPDSLKRHLKKQFQDQEAKATAQTDDKSEGSQSCTDSDTEVDNDDTVALLMHYLSLVKIKEKKRLIAGLGDLKPVAYIDHEGKEHSLLAASKVIDSLTSSQKKKREKGKTAVIPCHHTKKKKSFWGGNWRTLIFGIATQL
ncbi:uncharacterized protein BX663DRAFT_486017 [Cokeromyces recurvatus]|uniref:uncharacterized protein n=1 Tax=Cokeromyces recurvatus TaxID=90255 RepID=UPI00221FA0B2|nr:uncharacterized protein BX663DRAFT_486017 [Cokeromyces recurvatus]KAI7903287.1 hypothetical protein BX663DRAFT_486017 [Cokeromyces recurvatus]